MFSKLYYTQSELLLNLALYETISFRCKIYMPIAFYKTSAPAPRQHEHHPVQKARAQRPFPAQGPSHSVQASKHGQTVGLSMLWSTPVLPSWHCESLYRRSPHTATADWLNGAELAAAAQ